MPSFKNTLSFFILIATFLFGASNFSFAKRGDSSGQEFRAIYIVPVSESDLLKYAIFSNVEVEYKTLSDQRVKIEYSLPLELTGVENNVELIGTKNEDGSVTLEGHGSIAHCAADALLGRCEMTYKNIEFNPEKRRQILSAIANNNDAEFAKRLQVASRFQALVTGQYTEDTVMPLGKDDQMNQMSPLFIPLFNRGDSEIHGILEIIQ